MIFASEMLGQVPNASGIGCVRGNEHRNSINRPTADTNHHSEHYVLRRSIAKYETWVAYATEPTDYSLKG